MECSTSWHLRLTDARDTLRAALAHAVIEDELISRNPAGIVRLPTPRSRKLRPWLVAEACAFLESARADRIRCVTWQLQRSGRQLPHRQTKTGYPDAALPLPAIGIAALKQQAEAQAARLHDAGQAWHDTGLVITTRYGTPYEPRNLNRHLAVRCRAASVRYIKPHGMRRTCASVLAALDVHPRVAMRILRHSKIAVTMEIYAEVPDDSTRDALRRLGDQLDG